MKTITEFSAFNLRDAHSKAREIHAALQTEGKPAEELEQAKKETLNAYLAEKFKLEGEKLELFLKALEVVGAKPRELENLKRVVVYTIAEGEKVPGNVVQRESRAFGAEYLASLRPQKQDRRESGSKHSKGKGKGRGKRRGDLKGKRPDGGDERRGAGARDGEGGGGSRGPRRDGNTGPRRDGNTGPRRDANGQPGVPGPRRDANGQPGVPGPRRDANGQPGVPGPRPDSGKNPRRDGRPGRGPRNPAGPRAPRQDLPPGHMPVDQAARAMKSTGIRPVERPAAAPAPVSAPAPKTSDSDSSVV
jgi:hypothetical protein